MVRSLMVSCHGDESNAGSYPACPMRKGQDFGSIVYHCFRSTAVAIVMGAAACAPVPQEPIDLAEKSPPVQAAEFEAAISRLNKDNPHSPDMLNLRLEYADALSKLAGAGCQQRLALAQSQLDIVANEPETDLLLLLGPARIAGAGYRIHLASAACSGNEKQRQNELQQALQAAQYAVGLYSNALDYHSAAMMQSNVATTYRQLGDMNGAVSALKAAIALDRDYGFQTDAENESRLFLEWTTGKVNDGDVAALMKDFPARSAEFKFNWPSSNADVAVNVDDTRIINQKIVHATARMDLKRHVRVESDTTGAVSFGPVVETVSVPGDVGWTVSNQPGNGNYELGAWPTGTKWLEWPTVYFLASTLLQAPGIKIGRDGSFMSVVKPQSFATDLAAQVSIQIFARIPSQQGIQPRLDRAFSQEFVEAKAKQDYELETGAWMGAKLEQGVWHHISMPLFLPGLALGHNLVQHDVSFAFTRMVQCTMGSTDHLCAEIVVHATPDTGSLKSAVQKADPNYVSPKEYSLNVWSRTDLRLVIDPDTLVPYVYDIRQAWFDGVRKKDDPLVRLQQTVSTYIYH